MTTLVGVYPLLTGQDEDGADRFYDRLAALDGVDGLEIPWNGSMGIAPRRGWARYLPDRWQNVLTSIPGTMAALQRDPLYGLASTDDDGRAAAIGDVRAMRDAIVELADAAGHHAVRAVELHSAPMRRREWAMASKESFARSLEEISAWDWEGTRLLVEHVDGHDGVNPVKGFLSFEGEIAVAREFESVGVVVNWGRSAIEFQDPDRVVEHVSAARDAGVLSGIVFSGVSTEWADEHLPFAAEGDLRYGDPASLLTRDRMAAVLGAAGALGLVGLKMRPAPGRDSTAEVVDQVAHSVAALQRAERTGSVETGLARRPSAVTVTGGRE